MGISVNTGRDLFPTLSIGMISLPNPAAIYVIKTDEPIQDDQPSRFNPDDPPSHEWTSHPELISAIEGNQAMALNSYCNRSEAIVYLDVSDVQPVYRRQYPPAHSLKPFIDEQIKSWLPADKIGLAPRSCSYNLPLLVTLKTNRATGIKNPVVYASTRVRSTKIGNRIITRCHTLRIYSSFWQENGFLAPSTWSKACYSRRSTDHTSKYWFSHGTVYMKCCSFNLTPTLSVLQRTTSAMCTNSRCEAVSS